MALKDTVQIKAQSDKHSIKDKKIQLNEIHTSLRSCEINKEIWTSEKQDR